VSYMPEDIILSQEDDNKLYQQWSEEIVFLLRSQGKAIVAIDPEITERIPSSAASLRMKKAKVVEQVFKDLKVGELFIEGGSTAAAIIKQLHFETFFPMSELSPGVVRMIVKEAGGLCITVKPGSYAWPSDVWSF
jgi:uncharacterized protein YgbK (DUF1537 family)